MEEQDTEIKLKILEAASDLFMKYGIRSITMDDIARHLSMSKKTIYQFFKDKDEIVTLGTQAYMELEKAELEEIKEKSNNAIEELALVCQCMRKHVSDLNPSMLFDLQKYHPKAWGYFLEFKEGHIKNAIARNLRNGIEEGFFRDTIDPNIIAIFRVEQVELSFDDKVFPKKEFDFKEIQMQFFDLFVHGIVTKKGRELYLNYMNDNQLQ